MDKLQLVPLMCDAYLDAKTGQGVSLDCFRATCGDRATDSWSEQPVSVNLVLYHVISHKEVKRRQ